MGEKFKKVVGDWQFWGCIAIAAAGIALMVSIIAEGVSEKNAADFNSITEGEFAAAEYVSGTVDCLWGEFAYEEKVYDLGFFERDSGITPAHYYIMPLAGTADTDPKFAVLCLNETIRDKQHNDEAERLIEEYAAYLEGGKLPETSFKVVGKVSELGGELEEMLYEYFPEGLKETGEDMLCPYVITCGKKDGPPVKLIVSLSMILAGVVSSIGAASFALSGKKRVPLKDIDFTNFSG
ncbi:MAG: hypothetical protein NC078_02285 [Ruminococcus sp.]|nr:hypothetical protein [Ruminococcus sp.]